jgi:hypothetical protein
MAAHHDVIIRPHAIWWILVLGGLALFVAMSLHPDVYAYWVTHVHGLPEPPVLHIALWAALALHVFEGWYCFQGAKTLGLSASAKDWGIQSFLIGYPSTRLFLRLRERMKAEAAAEAT